MPALCKMCPRNHSATAAHRAIKLRFLNWEFYYMIVHNNAIESI